MSSSRDSADTTISWIVKILTYAWQVPNEPRPAKPPSMTRAELLSALAHQADPAMSADLAMLAGDTTEDLDSLS